MTLTHRPQLQLGSELVGGSLSTCLSLSMWLTSQLDEIQDSGGAVSYFPTGRSDTTEGGRHNEAEAPPGPGEQVTDARGGS